MGFEPITHKNPLWLVFPRARIRISVLSLPFLLIMLANEGFFPFCILFFSAAFHELGHIFALKKAGYSPRRTDILPMGALIVVPEGMSFRDELSVALSGPAASLSLFLLSLFFSVFFRSDYIIFSAAVNFTLFFINMLPIKKLDGGKALSCFLAIKSPENEKETASRLCDAVSNVSVILFFILGALALLLTKANLGLFICFLALAPLLS